MTDFISRRAAIKAICEDGTWLESQGCTEITMAERKQRDADILGELPSAQPERLTDDDFEAIRIHLNAFKEDLCNQGRWKEAEDYERLIDRFMSFASAQPDWNEMIVICDCCGHAIHVKRL